MLHFGVPWTCPAVALVAGPFHSESAVQCGRRWTGPALALFRRIDLSLGVCPVWHARRSKGHANRDGDCRNRVAGVVAARATCAGSGLRWSGLQGGARAGSLGVDDRGCQNPL